MCNFGVRDNLEISENFVVVVVVWLPMLITWMFRVTENLYYLVVRM